MAYCVLTMEHNQFQVQDWGILNLMNDMPEPLYCNFIIKGKKPKKCGKRATRKAQVGFFLHNGTSPLKQQ